METQTDDDWDQQYHASMASYGPVLPETPTTSYLNSMLLASKRKSSSSIPLERKTAPDLRESLNLARSYLRKAGGVQEKKSFLELKEYVQKASEAIEGLLTRKGNLLAQAESPTHKKQKNGVDLPSSEAATSAATDTDDLRAQPNRKPLMKDASTDTILTPSWWDSDVVIEKKAATKRRNAQGTAGSSSQPRNRVLDTEAESAMETDAENWSKVVKKPARQRKAAAAKPSQPPAPARLQPAGFSKKPPAIMIRPAEGKDYADTVQTLRTCGLSAQDIGTTVTKMRKTRDGCLLIELPKGAKSTTAAKHMATVLSTKFGDSIGRIQQLGTQVEVEILDIDSSSSASDVLEALRDAIPGQDDPAVRAERESISDVRIWPTRSGQQIATAKMPRHFATQIAKISIGWLICRVRPRTMPPERCFKCQTFGHNSRACTAKEDRTGACWKCGGTGHSMKTCQASDDSCLACELAGLPKSSHKPGSGACAARTQAARLKTSATNDD